MHNNRLSLHTDCVHMLLVDDEIFLRKLLRAALEKAGHCVTEASSGQEALDIMVSDTVEVVILDIMLPDIDGFDVCERIRSFSDIPIVMVTALDRPEDVVHGFELGADDYIVKPFSTVEVSVRIAAILRRLRWIDQRQSDRIHQHNGIMLNESARQVEVDDQPVHLTPIEFGLLRYLMQHVDQPVSKEELFQMVWGYCMNTGSNLVEVAIRRLRNKIETDPSHPTRVLTVPNLGYQFASGR